MVSYCFVISYLCVHILFISISVSKIFTSPRFMFTFVSRVSSVYICIYVHSIAKTGDGVSSQRPTSLQPPQGFQTVCCMSLQLFWAVSVPIINCLGISSRWRRRNSFFIAIDQRCDFTDCIWLGCFSEWAKREGRNQSHHHGQMIQEHQHVSKQHHQFFLSVNEYMYIYIYIHSTQYRKKKWYNMLIIGILQLWLFVKLYGLTSNFSNDTAESLTPSHHFDFLVHHLKHVAQHHFSPSKGNPSWTMKRLVVSDNWWQPSNPENPGFTKGLQVQKQQKKTANKCHALPSFFCDFEESKYHSEN